MNNEGGSSPLNYERTVYIELKPMEDKLNGTN